MSNFRVGQKVVCVNDKPFDDPAPGVKIVGDLDGLRKGMVYTVRSIIMSPTWGIPLILLDEIVRPDSFVSGVYFESGFDPCRFRPVAEPGTEKGMQILRDLLSNTDMPIEVDA